jgi:hypothetical protein
MYFKGIFRMSALSALATFGYQAMAPILPPDEKKNLASSKAAIFGFSEHRASAQNDSRSNA